MLIKTSTLTGPALDWAVCVAAGWAPTIRPAIECDNELVTPVFLGDNEQCPSTDWAQGGPIIERQGLHLRKSGCEWQCDYWNNSILNFDTRYGPTPLIAAMRCYVASKLGDTVEVPDELIG